jgi:rhamnosyltransferase
MMVTILMATFNGSTFIAEQLDSILAQSHQDWELLIRDDLSTDGTVSIIQKYVEADSRIKLLSLDGEHGSATINFSVLFDYAYTLRTPYVMFSDQDDIWKPNKIENSLRFIQKQELKLKQSTPVLVYGSLEYVDAAAQIIPQELKMPGALDFNILLTENHAYGCTMILNRALVDKIVHIPETSENHDYWVALVACTLGKAVLDPDKLILYRQHTSNVSGNVYRSKMSSRVNRYFKQVDFLLPVFVKNYRMIKSFFGIYKDVLDDETRELMAGYITAYNSDIFSLLFFMARNRFRKLGIMQTFAHYYTLLHLRRKVLEQL